MSMPTGWSKAKAAKLAIAAAALLLVGPALGNAVGGGETLFVAVEATQTNENMTVFVGKETGLVGGCPDEAEIEVRRDGIPVYPTVLGDMELDDCQGSLDIPYRAFASENGQYTVKAHVGDEIGETVVQIEKVVDWVTIRSFPNATEERTRIEVALHLAQAQPIKSSVFTSGELVLDVWWEDCKDDGPLGTGLGVLNETQECRASHDNVFHGRVPLNTTAVTNVIIPWDNFESEKYEDERPAEGDYNVTATFHNAEAKGNRNVPMDPTVFKEDPPGNWFEVDYE